MKHLKGISLIMIAMILCTSLASCSKPIDWSKYPVETIDALYTYDINDERQAVGIVNYVFVGKVLSFDDTEYRRVTETKLPDGTVSRFGVPYSHFTVVVTQNIKGDLITEEPIEVIKHGGITIDGEKLFVFSDGDAMPEVGETYVFRATAQEDGSLLVAGPKSNVRVENGDPNGIVDKYVDAYNNEIVNELVAEMKRYLSKYDVNYKE